MICPVDCIAITTQKLPKGERLWDSMNVVHLKDRTEVVGFVEGDEKVAPDTTVTVNTRDDQTLNIPSGDIDRIVERNPSSSTSTSLTLTCRSVCTAGFAPRFADGCLIMFDDMKGIEYSTFDRMELVFPFAKPEMYDQPSEVDNDQASE